MFIVNTGNSECVCQVWWWIVIWLVMLLPAFRCRFSFEQVIVLSCVYLDYWWSIIVFHSFSILYAQTICPGDGNHNCFISSNIILWIPMFVITWSMFPEHHLLNIYTTSTNERISVYWINIVTCILTPRAILLNKLAASQ